MPSKKPSRPVRVPYASAVYDAREIKAVLGVLKRPNRMIVAGHLVAEFEEKIATLFGKKRGIMVNSGSSANLIALEVANLPKGAEVITPALTFATTVTPIIQKGLVPVFADSELGTYQINAASVEKLITKKTKALMVPSLIGNLPNLKALHRIAKENDLVFIEDSCDTVGATFAGKPTGSYSDISTTSFYASHIVTAAGEGGMLCMSNEAWARRAIVMKSWGRESTLFGYHGASEDIEKRFAAKVDGIPYDAKFIFSELGYNFQTTDITAAFGLENLKRLPVFTKKRRANVKRLKSFFQAYEHFFILPEELPETETAWLAFPLTIRKEVPFTRPEITKYLEERNIQTRPVFTGNVTRQPAFKNLRAKTRAAGYPVADFIMERAFLIGCHHGMTEEMFTHLFTAFGSFLKKF